MVIARITNSVWNQIDANNYKVQLNPQLPGNTYRSLQKLVVQTITNVQILQCTFFKRQYAISSWPSPTTNNIITVTGDNVRTTSCILLKGNENVDKHHVTGFHVIDPD